MLSSMLCVCVYANMVCQRCMLHDDMYSHNIGSEVMITLFIIYAYNNNGAFTFDVKSVLNENLGGILSGTQC